MGKQKERRVLVQLPTYAPREAFLLCETMGCRNVVAAWVYPEEHPGPVKCSGCVHSEESR